MYRIFSPGRRRAALAISPPPFFADLFLQGFPLINYDEARRFFRTIDPETAKRYTDYWESVRPTGDMEIFQRYLFAFCSVHTTFKGNVNGYQAIKNYNDWANNPEVLLRNLKESGAGLHNNRAKFIKEFADVYWADPKSFCFTSKKRHVARRDEITSKIKGLGVAKVSFALEMIHPNQARVVCGDVHQLRLYGIEGLEYNSSAKGRAIYRKMENHWVVNSHKAGVSPYVARCIFWDQLQNKPNPRYWSYVLEKEGMGYAC